ncbi:hypothetical protein AALO_G00094580 [Alosa alosa]|uniref:Integrase core domain-containing protein n=1 Tax=Alosa alosa TaxID=278164 RepID=A0AAV6GWE5_9TELE|nr:uncharacterized protein LOC125297060 [Alosa alosa]KAG5278045.1 hypothetical protein AALO_G00094580 [Alosa alosa]
MYCPFCSNELQHLAVYCGFCGTKVEFLKSLQCQDAEAPEELIFKYFAEGHSYKVIMDLLATKHNISLSLRTLKRKLKNAGLSKRRNYTPVATIRAAIAEELKGSGQLLGYRSMCQTLRQKYSFVVRRDDVMHLLRELDPPAVHNRTMRRFTRRTYHSMGPNEVWHIDGYDKLKPFGLAISGCIDGFSRKIMWLKCGKSNSDPSVIALNYMECVAQHGLVPKRLRTDCGTENGLMAALHCTLRSEHTDEFAGATSHMYGASTSNQRIESWWSNFRKQRGQFWMNLFSDMRERHLFNGSPEHKSLLRYCFLDVVRKDLDEYKTLWNCHTIRPVRQSQCPSGRPEAMYNVPHRFNGENCGLTVSAQTLSQLYDLIPAPLTLGTDEGNANFHILQRQGGL